MPQSNAEANRLMEEQRLGYGDYNLSDAELEEELEEAEAAPDEDYWGSNLLREKPQRKAWVCDCCGYIWWL